MDPIDTFILVSGLAGNHVGSVEVDSDKAGMVVTRRVGQFCETLAMAVYLAPQWTSYDGAVLIGMYAVSIHTNKVEYVAVIHDPAAFPELATLRPE